MADLLKNLTDPSWWIGIVVVGLAINLLSNYLYTATGDLFAGFRLGWRKAKERQVQRRLEIVGALRTDESKRERYREAMKEYRHDEIVLMLWTLCLVLLSMGVFFAAVSSVSLVWLTRSALVLSGIFFLMSLTARFRGNHVRGLLEEAANG